MTGRTNMADAQYLSILKQLLDRGVYREGRNGSTYGLFGHQMRFNLADGFPLLTTKKVHFKSVVVELLWMLRGDTNVQYLHDHGVTIWDEWADESGDLGWVYGAQWRGAGAYYRENRPEGGYYEGGVDQIRRVIDGLRADPYGRRHIVDAWDPKRVDEMALPPCHMVFQFHVANGRLSCHLYQRSADWFLGVPFNIASYALLTELVAQEVGLEAGDLIMSFGDLHLYANHVDQAREQLQRSTRSLPTLGFSKRPWSVLDGSMRPDDVVLVGYDPHPAIKAEVSK